MKVYIRLETFTGFYQGAWCLDNFYENTMECIDCNYNPLKHRDEWEFTDMKGWQQHFATEYSTAFFDLIDTHLGLKFEVASVSVWSPQTYNYATDEIDCEAEIEDVEWRNKIVELMDQNKAIMSEIIANNHTSCSGFMSFMSNKFETWRGIISGEIDDDDDMLYISYALMYLLFIKSEMSRGQVNDAIAFALSDDSEIWYPDLKPWSEEAIEEWESIKNAENIDE